MKLILKLVYLLHSFRCDGCCDNLGSDPYGKMFAGHILLVLVSISTATALFPK